jgi:hypothetical protein
VRFGQSFAKLNKTAVQAVVASHVDRSVTNSRMQENTCEHSKGITGVLQNLVRDGLLSQQNHGAGQATAWRRTPPKATPIGRRLPPIGPICRTIIRDSGLVATSLVRPKD